MPPVCGSLIKDITQDCDNPMIAGAKDRLLLGNFDEILSVTRTGGNHLIVEDITLVSGGARMFQYDGKNNSNEPSFALVIKDFAEVYEHTLKFKVFLNDGGTKQELESMAKGRVFAISENNHIGPDGNSAFEVLGLETGLVLTVHTRDTADDATQGAHNLELKSSAKSPEPHVPAAFFLTNFAITKALVDALLVPTA